MNTYADALGITLSGHISVITGASRGMGRAMALALAGAGARVIVTGRDTAALSDTVKSATELGGHVVAHALDVTDSVAVDAFAHDVWSEFGPIDSVFANAGVSLVKPAIDTSDDDFETIWRTNVLGTFATVRAFGSLMLDRGHGKLITVSSDIGIRGSAGWVAYGASKAAVISMTKTLAWEWAPSLTVNAIAPGAFATDINSHLLAIPEVTAEIETATPLGRIGRPAEVGPLAVFLASTGSDFMTGQVVSIDGGIQRS